MPRPYGSVDYIDRRYGIDDRRLHRSALIAPYTILAHSGLLGYNAPIQTFRTAHTNQELHLA